MGGLQFLMQQVTNSGFKHRSTMLRCVVGPDFHAGFVRAILLTF